MGLLKEFCISYLYISVIDELYGPPAFMFDPDKDDTVGVACRQLLIRLIPLHKDHLKERETFTVYGFNLES